MIDLLHEIIQGQGEGRIALAHQFQSMVWNSDGAIGNEPLDEILRSLAYDLDFCQTDEDIEREVKSAIDQIEALSKS